MSGPQPTEKSAPVKWEGVSFINKIEYSSDQVVYALRSRCMLVVQINICHLLVDKVE